MLATAATFCLISWAVANRGPTYPSMFNPLALIFVTITEALFLGEPITVGRLVSRHGIDLRFPLIMQVLFHSYSTINMVTKMYELIVRFAQQLQRDCSLIGMSLIIAGLYSFLWGKSKESKNTTQPRVAMIEASEVVPDKSTALQTSAVVMPAASPSTTTTTTAAVFGNAKPNEDEMFF